MEAERRRNTKSVKVTSRADLDTFIYRQHSNMYAKMIAVALCIVSALGFVNSEAAKYPAGVSPHLCPNYPYCDNALLGAHANAAAGHANSYAGHGYAAPAYPVSVYGAVAPVAHGYPAGVNPHTCPNYPYCGPTPAHIPSYSGWTAPLHNAWAAPVSYSYGGPAAYGHGAPAHGAARYPAGVDPHSCPNYPYCH